jgi:hypothetical protein
MRIRKIKMCLMAILAPEWMAMWALRQFLHARKLRDMYNRTAGNEGKVKKPCLLYT